MRTGKKDDLARRNMDLRDDVVASVDRAQIEKAPLVMVPDGHFNAREVVNGLFVIHEALLAVGAFHFDFQFMHFSPLFKVKS